MENNYLPIFLSSRLKEILHRINDDISMSILLLEDNNDYIFPFSYLDITDTEGTISFLPYNKIKDVPRERGTTDIIWSFPARSDIRIGRLVNKIAPFYSPVEIEKWVNSFKAEYRNVLKNIRFKIIEGKDIVKYYNAKFYARGNGTLNKSCMRHDNCSDFMNLYVNNPDKIKMVILFEDKDIISGRALLWKLDEANSYFLDRIYVKDESDTILFKKYAEKNNWLYKTAQTYDSINVIKNGKEQYVDMKVTVKGNYKNFPYLDTLFFYNKKDNYLTNIVKEYETIPTIIKLREINGRDSGNENFVFDKLNEEFIGIEESVYCLCGDLYTHKNNVFFSKDHDEFISSSKLRYSTYYKKFLFKSVYSYHMGTFLMTNDAIKVYLDKEKKTFDYYLMKDLNTLFFEVKNDFYLKSLLVKGINNKYYFIDEYDENLVKSIAVSRNEDNAADEIIQFLNSQMKQRMEEKKSRVEEKKSRLEEKKSRMDEIRSSPFYESSYTTTFPKVRRG